MIGRLTGKIVADGPDGVVVDVGGVGYDVVVPLGTLGRTRADDAGRVTLWVHTHVREDMLALYGFADEAERTAFRALLAVSNVGPKIAVAVLGALPAAELSRAIAKQDLAALKGISGVGKKIAERLLLELRDKLPAVVGALPLPAPGRATPAPPSSGEERLRAMLTGMGFKSGEVDRALLALAPRMAAQAGDGASHGQGHEIEALLREALALLAK